MKTIVIYTSQTGFTKRYAEWIREASGAECVDFKQAKKIKLSDYDAIIFGGWFMAGGIKNLAWFKNQIPELSAAGKKSLFMELEEALQKVQTSLVQYAEILPTKNGIP